MITIGKRIKQVRQYRKWNQSQLAKKIQSHAPEVSHWENGKRIPGLKTVEKLAKALDIQFEWLLTGNGVGFITRDKYSSKFPVEEVREDARELEDDEKIEKLAFENELDQTDFRLFQESSLEEGAPSSRAFETQLRDQEWIELNYDYVRSLKFIFDFGTDEDITEITGTLGKIDLRIKKRFGKNKGSPQKENFPNQE